MRIIMSGCCKTRYNYQVGGLGVSYNQAVKCVLKCVKIYPCNRNLFFLGAIEESDMESVVINSTRG